MKLLKAQWDRSAAVAAVLIGLISLLLGWIGVSGTEYLAEQMSFVASGGLFGIFFLGLGAALWISADLRDEWRKLDSVEIALTDALDRLVPLAGEPAVRGAVTALPETVDAAAPLVRRARPKPAGHAARAAAEQ